jgi:stage II sporulation protein D
MRRLAILISLTAALAAAPIVLAAAPAARAAAIFQIDGAGNGHGIGMSQYGAEGYALHGASYRAILAHYYQGTGLGQVDPNQLVRVLLATGPASFSGATTASAPGAKPTPLTAGSTYSVRVLAGGELGLFTQAGRKLAAFSGVPLSVSGTGPLTLAGLGQYRGGFEFRDVGGAVQTVNAVGVDDYVRGVVAAEMPANWAPAALEAQAVAARTYALTSQVGGDGYQLYPDTRSQMYGGVTAETPSTDAAVAATSGQIVTYNGAPAITYFFASSGGYTESIQNVWLGAAPEPWLRGVPDPYDDAAGNPYYRWSRRYWLAAARGRLGSLVVGALRGVLVTQRGVSPRVMDAEVLGSAGTSAVSGSELEQLFGLPSTYMRFTTIASNASAERAVPLARLRRLRPAAVGATLRATSWKLWGFVFPAAKGATVTVQRWSARRWQPVRRLMVGSAGAYAAPRLPAGSYRVVFAGVAGPTVTAG